MSTAIQPPSVGFKYRVIFGATNSISVSLTTSAASAGTGGPSSTLKNPSVTPVKLRPVTLTVSPPNADAAASSYGPVIESMTGPSNLNGIRLLSTTSSGAGRSSWYATAK